jgi:hypothetical protein
LVTGNGSQITSVLERWKGINSASTTSLLSKWDTPFKDFDIEKSFSLAAGEEAGGENGNATSASGGQSHHATSHSHGSHTHGSHRHRCATAHDRLTLVLYLSRFTPVV